MIIKNSQQDVNIEEPIHVKKVSLKISGGADSAIVGYMLSKYVAEERPDIKIFPLTTNHPKKPYQGVYASRIINFYKEIFGEHIFGKHYINTVDVMDTNEDYINAQTTNMEKTYKNEKIQRNYSGITSNPPLDIIDTFRKPNGKLIKDAKNLDGDIEVKIIGLRPGEKLYEELLATEENMLPTHHKKIMIAKVTNLDTQKSKESVITLCDLCEYSDVNSIVTKLKEIVPEYISQNSSFEKLDAI